MSFINADIELSQLPAAEEGTLRPVHRDYLALLRIEWAVTSAVLLLGGALLIYFVPSTRLEGWPFIVIPVALFLAAYYFIQERSFPFMAFAIRERDVIYQKGWLVRRTKVCPYSRVQNCSIQSGPLERKKGLASLILFTAGSEGADLKIPGLLQHEAEELRQYILSQVNGATRSF
jgi:membrane protein YdbS with pleckstrin-like domain